MQRRERELVGRLSLTVDRDALAARLRDLRVPTLVMFGDADTLTPAREAAACKTRRRAHAVKDR